MGGMVTWRVFQLLLYQTGVGISGAPRRDEVANFVNLTNILGQPRVERLGMRGAGTGWRGHANKTFTPTSLLKRWGGGTLCVTRTLFLPLAFPSLEPETRLAQSDCVNFWNLLTKDCLDVSEM